jgi:hypothetical protein
MAGRSVKANGYEVHFLRRGRQAQILARNIKMLAAAKDVADREYKSQQR